MLTDNWNWYYIPASYAWSSSSASSTLKASGEIVNGKTGGEVGNGDENQWESGREEAASLASARSFSLLYRCILSESPFITNVGIVVSIFVQSPLVAACIISSYAGMEAGTLPFPFPPLR